jgi:hypothetical protein
MATEPQHSETMSGAPASSEPADFGANAALILAALGRIEAVVRDERAALASLRASLAEMAQAIARAKAVADSENAAAMLDEFEHRVDAMIGIAGGTPEAGPPAAEPATQPVAESDQVPTVSGVVLRLGPGDAAPEPAAAETEPPAENAGDKGPTVAMLTAMVEALSASIQTPGPEPEADVAALASQASEPPTEALELAPELTAAPLETEATATTTPEAEPVAQAEAEPVAEAEPSSPPGEALAQEITLLASFEQMEARPFPPPEVGTAVIFTSRFEPVAAPEPESPTEHGLASPAPSEPDAPPDPDATAGPDATAEPDQIAMTESAEFQPLAEPVAETPPEPVPAAAPEPAAMADVAAVATTAELATAEPEAMAPPAEASAQLQSAEAEFDPTDFLFGPEPEPDPAAFLLDPAPPPRTQKAVLPQAEFVAVPPEPPHPEEQDAAEQSTEPSKAEEPQAAIAENDQAVQPTPEPHDPLHALKAMSPNERLAIFS